MACLNAKLSPKNGQPETAPKNSHGYHTFSIRIYEICVVILLRVEKSCSHDSELILRTSSISTGFSEYEILHV